MDEWMTLRGVQATDFAVAQAGEAEGEDLACDGDLGDLAAAALGDPFEGLGQRPVALGVALGGLDERPAQRAPDPSRLMCPRRALASELRTVGVSPAHAHKCRADGKRSMAPI